MSSLEIEGVERLARDELAASQDLPAQTPTERWRAMAPRPRESMGMRRRVLFWLERKARRVLHEIRERRGR
jgi:hypothetical protein